jgi:hypothetical protein
MTTMINLQKIGTVLRKAIALQSRPTEESFGELPDVLVWMRALIAIAFGAFLGFHQVKSGAAFVQGLNLITFVPFVYCRFFLGTQTGQFDMPAVAGGTLPALALFLLTWIYLFTAAFPSDEVRLAAALMTATSVDTSGGASAGTSLSAVGDPATGPDIAGGGSEF